MEQMVQHRSGLQKAFTHYSDHGQDFWGDFEWHTHFGIIYIDGEFFGMMRPCIENDPYRFCKQGEHDAWYISYVYGDGCLKRLGQICLAVDPQAKRIGFTRRSDKNNTRFIDIERIMRKL